MFQVFFLTAVKPGSFSELQDALHPSVLQSCGKSKFCRQRASCVYTSGIDGYLLLQTDYIVQSAVGC